MTVEGFIQLNDSKKQFHFLQSLDITNINTEVENLHPCTHEILGNAQNQERVNEPLERFFQK